MSLFRDESPTVGVVTFDPVKPGLGVGSAGTASGAQNGALWYDATLNSFQLVQDNAQGGIPSSPAALSIAAAVTNTNATSATALMTYAFLPGSLNVVGKTLDIYAAGTYTTDGGTGRTITFAVTLGDGTNTRTIATYTTGATTASQTKFPWNYDATIITQAVGSSGTVYGHGILNITLGSSIGGALTSYNDQNNAASSALDLTKTITLTLTQLYSGSNAGNIFVEDTLALMLAN